MSHLLKKLSPQQREDLMQKILNLPQDKQAEVLLYLLKQPTNTEL
jgi:DNA-directed RNA polymerase specialized sigma24 family protein